jgi:Xaa-Pro aminopeptidase
LNKRVNLFIDYIKSAGCEAALIHKHENMRYFAGYTGEGCLLLNGAGISILTNFLYAEQAERESGNCRVVRVDNGVKMDEALSLLVAPAASVAVETDCLTVDQYKELERILPSAELRPLDGIPEKMRCIKDEGELQSIERACAIACAAFNELLRFIKPGLTERAIAAKLDYTLQELGSEDPAFPTIACAGINGSLPHAVPGDHAISKGELLTIDFGAQVNGYKSDMTRTIAIGKPSPKLKSIYKAVLEAQTLAINALKPGARCCDIDSIARTFLESVYPGAFGHSLGHGVGLCVHEQPGLSSKDKRVLEAGHVITIEPGVYIKGVGGCRIEDMGAMSESGFHNMVSSPRELITI